jgi:hypothetical protein
VLEVVDVVWRLPCPCGECGEREGAWQYLQSCDQTQKVEEKAQHKLEEGIRVFVLYCTVLKCHRQYGRWALCSPLQGEGKGGDVMVKQSNVTTRLLGLANIYGCSYWLSLLAKCF